VYAIFASAFLALMLFVFSGMDFIYSTFLGDQEKCTDYLPIDHFQSLDELFPNFHVSQLLYMQRTGFLWEEELLAH